MKHECNVLCEGGRHAEITYTTLPDAVSARLEMEAEAAAQGYEVLDFRPAQEAPPIRHFMNEKPELTASWSAFAAEHGRDVEDFKYPWLVIVAKLEGAVK